MLGVYEIRSEDTNYIVAKYKKSERAGLLYNNHINNS